ncbi:MAG: lipoyl protein ligase domain-containing protein [Castellaniella sp.]|uniref:lipoyl protein ligase domain-containing protein n=1 Tax=Castellaniella sp. TaxID=1955812 RepID=UPI003A8506B2
MNQAMPEAHPGAYRLLEIASDTGPLADEHLLTPALQMPVACLWQAAPGLVVPRTYAARPEFATVQADFAARGCPVHVRQSGGGVVPQGPGILNLSLAQVFAGRPLDHSERLYRHLCALIGDTLATFGIATRAQAVEGSFCDGRYNLAVPSPTRKIAGTAQLWRRIPGHAPDRHVGLVHALILAQGDPAGMTANANALETALGTARRYDADRIATLDRLLPPAQRPGFPAALEARLQETLRTRPSLPTTAPARPRPEP